MDLETAGRYVVELARLVSDAQRLGSRLVNARGESVFVENEAVDRLPGDGAPLAVPRTGCQLAWACTSMPNP
ncbi:MAG TPA: hypothetical protein VK701_08620 [Solirubrobacteraceae bacterium]|nr:hypothetical protein [Solirubrobacteraceae bacterium]